MTIELIQPENVYALVVGIEKYKGGSEWDLNGPANDAFKFANWLLERDVKPENIQLFLSPLDKNVGLIQDAKAKGLIPFPADRNHIDPAIRYKLTSQGNRGDLLYVFWGGHGIVTKTNATTRRLFFADTDNINKWNLDFNSLIDALNTFAHSSGFKLQNFLIDACANTYYQGLYETIGAEAAASKFITNGEQGKARQFVLFASAEYEVAINEATEGTGRFSNAVLNELQQKPLLPDMKALAEQIKANFRERQQSEPVYKWLKVGDDEDEEDRIKLKDVVVQQKRQPLSPGKQLKLQYLQKKLDGLNQKRQKVESRIDGVLPADVLTKDALENQLYIILDDITEVKQKIQIEEKKSNGYVNSDVDRTEANTDGGDVAQRDIDKRNITINIITGSSNAQSQSHLTVEVSKILGVGIDLEAAIASAYQSALPTDASLHPVQTNDKISELADRRVLHKFIEILANDRTVSESTRAELQKIISTSDGETNSDRADTTSKKRLRSYLIVVLRPEPNLKFCVNAWLIPDDSVKGSSRFSSLDINEEKKGVVCSLSDISEVVTELLEHSLEYMLGKDYDLTIEFFLPIDALSTELDRLEITDFLESYPLGKEFKVLVRSYERLENNYLSRYLPQWRSNWDRATTNFQTVPILDSFKPFSTINNCNWKKLAVDLKEKIGIKITCILPELEQKSLFKAILISAIPIAVWMRKDIQECDRESKLDCLLTSGNLETLPEYIRKEREEAYICDDPEEHFGNHLVLLWEDPNRLTPDVMARLLPTGQ